MTEPGKEVRPIEWPPPDVWEEPEYANTVLVNHTPWDFSLHFGRVGIPANPPKSGSSTSKAKPKGIPVDPVAVITISPRTMKELLDVLKVQWRNYTEEYGRPAGMRITRVDDTTPEA